MSLLEAIVVIISATALLIVIFALTASALGNYNFRLPEFLTDSVKAIWAAFIAGGMAVLAGALDAALRKERPSINYLYYIVGTTIGLLVLVLGLIWLMPKPDHPLVVPNGATPLDVLSKGFKDRNFALQTRASVVPVAAAFQLTGKISLIDRHFTGSAEGRVDRVAPPGGIPAGLSIGRVALFVCYFPEPKPGMPSSIAMQPELVTVDNSTEIAVPLPMGTETVKIPRFEFRIEVPATTHPEAVWLCAGLFAPNQAQVSFAI